MVLPASRVNSPLSISCLEAPGHFAWLADALLGAAKPIHGELLHWHVPGSMESVHPELIFRVLSYLLIVILAAILVVLSEDTGPENR